MTGTEIKNLCLAKGIDFIPHHECAICGRSVGWYLFGRWPPYEVAFSGDCDCVYNYSARPDTWDSIAEWVCGPDGQLKERYMDLLAK